MIRLLRLSPLFRTLESTNAQLTNRAASLEAEVSNLHHAVDELTREKILLEDRLESAADDRDRMWQTMQSALAGERYAYQMQINHVVQKSGGGIPYPDVHSLPPSTAYTQEAGPVGRRGRRLPSEVIAEQNSRALEEFLLHKAEAVNG